MNTKSCREWGSVIGVIALGMLAFGISIQYAPAGDDDRTSIDRTKGKETIAQAAKQTTINRLTAAASADRNEGDNDGRASSQGKKREKLKYAIYRREPTQADADSNNDRFWRVVSAVPVGGAGSRSSVVGGGVGDPCTCDSECAPDGSCRVANCVEGACVVTDSPVDTRCDLDGLFCTDDRCVRGPTGISCEATGREPCAKKCSGGVVPNEINCRTDRDCSEVDACQAKPKTFCNETDRRCELANGLGRCCDAGTCSYVTETACAGSWLRIEDPDDLLHNCDCPAYSGGITGIDPRGGGGAEAGVVVPAQRRCDIGGNICEVDADCWPRCNGGDRVNESCDVDSDCPGSSCNDAKDQCVADVTECDGLLAVGDDYSLDGGSWMRLQRFHFRGGVDNPKETVVFEFWDDSSPPNRVDAFAVRFDHVGIFDYAIEVDCAPNCDLNQPCLGFAGHPLCETEQDPPFNIPPRGFVTARARQIINPEFGEDDASFHWLNIAGSPIAGTNDPSVLWVGNVADLDPNTTSFPLNPGGPVTGPLANNVLAFELLGEPITPATGACCNRADGTCTDTLEFECTFCTGSGEACTLTRPGTGSTRTTRGGIGRARDCGLSRVQRCSSRDWRGPRTIGELLNADGELCSDAPCDGAACCDDATGECTVVASAGECTGTFLGHGVACEPNRCTQPLQRCSRSHVACASDGDCDVDLGVCDAGLCYSQDPSDFPGPDPDLPCSVSAQDCFTPPGTPAPLCISAEGHCNVSDGTCADGSTCVGNDVCGRSGADSCRDIFACTSNAELCTDDPSACPGGAGECALVSAGSTPFAITVPGLFDDPAVVAFTISGDASPAKFKEDCSDPGGNQPGWYDLFSVDKSATVTITYCGNDPITVPDANWLHPACPCTGSQTIFADEDANGPKFGNGAACNNDFCCEDGNFSMQLTVPAGTYTLEQQDSKACVFGTDVVGGCDTDEGCIVQGDVCRSNRIPYTMQMHVRAALPAACCSVTTVCSNNPAQECVSDTDCGGGSCDPTDLCEQLDEFTCGKKGGTWIGDPPPPLQPVADCTTDVCATGSCCLANPAVITERCDDLALNTAAACLADNPGNVYNGFIPCTIGEIDLRPCKVCPFFDQSHCQLDTGNIIFVADRQTPRRTIEDFIPTGSLIESVCWVGCWLGETDLAAQFECSGTTGGGGGRPPLHYHGTFFEDDFGLPGMPVAGQPTTNEGDIGYELAVAAEEPTAPNSRCSFLNARLDPPLQVQPNECHWVEFSGLGEIQGQGICLAYWLDSLDGNNLRVVDTDGEITLGDIRNRDNTFCMSTGIVGATAPPVSLDGGCGNRAVACCLPDGSCADTDFVSCIGSVANPKFAFPVPGFTCADDPCPPLPPNDDCENATIVCEAEFSAPLPLGNSGVCPGQPGGGVPGDVCDPAANGGQGDCLAINRNANLTCTPRVPPESGDTYRCQVNTSNILASGDGPELGGCPGTDLKGDVWYRFTSPCTGRMTIRTCAAGTYDGKMTIQKNDGCPDANTRNCSVVGGVPPCQLGCNDDFCPGSETTEGFNVDITKDQSYLIQVGGWASNSDDNSAGRGTTVLDIGMLCDFIPDVQAPAVAATPHDRLKNRVISIDPTTNPGAVVMKVELLACSTSGDPCVEDADCGGGETCDPSAMLGWVSDPITLGAASQMPEGSTVVRVQKDMPALRVWPETVVHISDCEIAPVQGYAISASTDGVIFSTSLRIGTIVKPGGKNWADYVASAAGGVFTPPNEILNVDDLSALLFFFQGRTVSDPAYVVTTLELAGEIPTFVISAADLSEWLRAFGGGTYPPPSFLLNPSGDPANCP